MSAQLASANGTIRVTLVRSLHGRLKNHQASVRGLGLRRMHQTVEVIDTPENRGMISKAYYLLRVEETSTGEGAGTGTHS